MKEKAKTYALYAALGAAVVLSIACAWLGLKQAVQGAESSDARGTVPTSEGAAAQRLLAEIFAGLASEDSYERRRALLFCSCIVDSDTGKSFLELLWSADRAERDKATEYVRELVGKNVPAHLRRIREEDRKGLREALQAIECYLEARAADD